MNFLYCIDENYNIQTLSSRKSLSKCVSKEINIYIIHKEPRTFLAHKEKILKMKNIKIFLFMSLKRPAI